MTPPTARKRTAAPQRAAEPTPSAGRRSIGADAVAQAPGERMRPVGVTHVVDGWQPVCGEPRVRFVFPGCTLDDAAEVCDACATGTTTKRVPRQRRVASV